MLSHPSVILLLGTDHSSKIRDARTASSASDSMMLLRTDPGQGTPQLPLDPARPARRTSPATASTRSTRRYQIGGPALAIRTVRSFTDVEVNHVVVVDFDAFTKVIDKVGGVDINVPAPILSNKFDCPYRLRRAATAGRAGGSRRASST